MITDNELREFIAEYTQKVNGRHTTVQRLQAALHGKFYHSADTPKELLARCEELGLLYHDKESIKLEQRKKSFRLWR